MPKATKCLLAIVCLTFGMPALAGGMSQIPVQLLNIDNQGRTEFINNALTETGLAGDGTVRYENFKSVIVGGDESGSDFKGALFIYGVTIDSRANGYQRFHCRQRLSVGSFENYTTPIQCQKV